MAGPKAQYESSLVVSRSETLMYAVIAGRITHYEYAFHKFERTELYHGSPPARDRLHCGYWLYLAAASLVQSSMDPLLH